MIRGLVVVAVGGAVMSFLCVGASGALTRHHWHVPSVNVNVDDEGDGPDLVLTGKEPVVTRNLAWAGSDALTFSVPSQISFTQGAAASITLTGPDALVDHIVMDGDDIELNRHVQGDINHMLKIVVVAPHLSSFTLEAAQDLAIQSIAVDTLHLEIDGAGKITAKGTARELHMEIDGAGDADLGALAATDAHVEINGIGHVIASPTGDAHLEINGAGSIKLTTHPAHITQEINGAGSIDQADGPTQQSL